mmetsp:Transcript_10309/g.30230  ORF Transcript_10309/g.30230 Transcript_10309/m.30230 type:complete len:548 (+) Transcript_10309:343-1986(+)
MNGPSDSAKRTPMDMVLPMGRSLAIHAVVGQLGEFHRTTQPGSPPRIQVMQMTSSRTINGQLVRRQTRKRRDQSWESSIQGRYKKNVSMFIDNYAIPGVRTTYVDIAWNFPDDTEDVFHLIFGEAIVNTPGGVLHHFVITGCPEKWPAEMHGKVVVGSREVRRSCQIPIGGWAPGGNVMAMPSWAGKPIGNNAKVKAFIANVHFDNYALKEDLVSRDGLRFYYTPTLRPEELTQLFTLQATYNPTMLIPPKNQRYFMTRECTVDIKIATSKQPVEAQVVYAGFRAHLMGVEMAYERIRGNDRLSIAVRSPWYFDDQSNTNVYVQNITLKTGDKLSSACIFNSQGRDDMTVIGLETTDEMCWLHVNLRPGGLEANCGGRIWTGELSEEESLLGLQLKHPISTADGVWTSSPAEGAPLTTVFSNINQSENFQSGNSQSENSGTCKEGRPQLQSLCPQLLLVVQAGSGDCDKSMGELAMGKGMNARIAALRANYTLLQACCTDACKTACPQRAVCTGAGAAPERSSPTSKASSPILSLTSMALLGLIFTG